MLLTIVTPTILRRSLAETCRSIDEQSFTEWEHLVVVDRPNEDLSILDTIKHPNRRIIMCPRAHMNSGNSCRHHAYQLAMGDYVCQMDDDDHYLPGAFFEIAHAAYKH